MSSHRVDDHSTRSTTDHPPRLCIGLPVYNGERFLEEALDSILSQTFVDFELIVSDNASTDSTPAIVSRYVERDPRVRYVRHDRNVGASANFDSVWRRCRSEYFKWTAADDTCAPRFVEACVEVLDADPDVGLAYPSAAFIGPDSMITHGFSDRVTTPDVWASDCVRRTGQIVDVLLQDGSAANVMIFGVIRSEVLARVRPIGNYFGADMPLVAELAIASGVVEVPETMSFLRRHVGSSSTYDRSPSAKGQQDFYDPSVRGALRLQWNLRRRYVALFGLAATAPVGPVSRVRMIGSVIAAIGRRLKWRVNFERDARKGTAQPEFSWPGGPTHWSEATRNA